MRHEKFLNVKVSRYCDDMVINTKPLTDKIENLAKFRILSLVISIYLSCSRLTLNKRMNQYWLPLNIYKSVPIYNYYHINVRVGKWLGVFNVYSDEHNVPLPIYLDLLKITSFNFVTSGNRNKNNERV